MKKIKKLLAIFIIVGMFISFIPTNIKAEDTTPTQQGESYTEEEELSPQEKARRAAAERQAALQQELDNSPKENTNETWQAIDKVTRPAEPQQETSAPASPKKGSESTDKGNANLLGNSLGAPANSGEIDKISITANIVWKDGDNVDDLRSELTLKLVGRTTPSNKLASSVEVPIGDRTFFDFTGAGKPTTFDDEPIKYTLTVSGYNQEKYEVEIDETVDNATGNIVFTVTLTHNPEEAYTSITATKVWEDTKDTHPSVFFLLYANGAYTGLYQEVTDDSLTVEYTDSTRMPKYEGGELIEYTIVESIDNAGDPVTPEDYTYEVTGDPENGFTVTNYPDTQLTIEIEKVWDDDNNRDGIRPDTLTYTVTGKVEEETVVTETIVLTSEDDWTSKSIEVDNFYERKQVSYVVEEEEIEGYETTSESTVIPGNATSGDTKWVLKYTNKHKPETVSFTVEKIWHDEDNEYNSRPAEVYAAVYVNNKLVRQRALNEANGWTTTISASTQYKYENGKEIEYEIRERWGEYVAQKEKYEPYEVEDLGEGNYQIHNYLKPAYIHLTIEKDWQDNNNQGGFRPESLTVEIKGKVMGFDDPVSVVQLDLNEENEWKTTVDLPRSHDGLFISYDILEDTPTGYVEPDPTNEDDYVWSGDEIYTDEDLYTDLTSSLKIVNRPEMVTIDVTKVWDDEGYTENRPDKINIRVFRNDVYIRNRALSGSKDEAEWTLEGITGNAANPFFKYDSEGNEYVYRVEESNEPVEGDSVPIPNYDLVSNEGSVEEGFTLTNRFVPQFTTVTIQKVWDDDESTSRPNVYVRLVNNGTTVRDAYLNSTTNPAWSATFTDIPVFDANGNEIDYKAEEEAIPGYITPSIVKEGNALHGYTFTITNANRASVKVEKAWEDDENRDGIRPETVTVNLLADDNPVDSVELSQANGWKYEFEDLPRYVDNQPVTYSVEEVEIEGYETEITGDAKTGFTITNTHSPEIYKSISVTKEWKDGDNRDGKRPETVYVRLYKGEEYAGKQKALSEANEWTTKINSSAANPIYVYENGEKIEYTIVESSKQKGDPVPIEGYEMDIEGDAEEGFKLINIHKSELVEINVQKVWDDDENRDGVRPDEVYVVVYADGEKVRQRALNENNEWKTTIKAEKQYKYDSGEEIQYEIKESWVKGEVTEEDPNGNYTTTIEGTVEDGFTITNTHTPEVYETISVKKEWKDGENRDGLRPETIYARLYKGDVYAGKQKALSEANEWTSEFETKVSNPLYVYENGEKIEYTIVESTKPSGDPIALENYDVTVEGDAEQGFVVTNTHAPELVEFEVTKVWEDEDDTDGFRPDEVYAVVYANGEQVRQRALNENNEWKTTIKAETQYKYEDGEEIEYEIKESWVKGEVTLEDPDGNYTTIIEGDVENGFTITNTHEVVRIEHTVTIEWDDDENRDGVRPESVTVYLVRDGERVEGSKVVLNGSNGWSHTWTDLLKINSETGLDAEYTVEADPLDTDEYIGPEVIPSNEPLLFMPLLRAPGDDLSGDGDGSSDAGEEGGRDTQDNTAGSGTLLKYTHEPEKIDIEGHKIWVDNDNQDGVRPESITLNLYADGEKVDTVELTAEDATDKNTWAYSFTDLFKYDKGQAIEYKVAEEAVKDYTLSVHGYDIYNTYTPDKTFLTVIKLWDDDRNRDGIRPDNVIVRLLADGEEVSRASISEATGWFIIFDELDVYRPEGVEIEYTIEEDEVEGYKAEITGDQVEGYIITNTHEPETISITLNAEWTDENNKYNLRPSSVTVHLLANGEVVATTKLTAANGWKLTLEDLPKYANGEEIEYTVAQNPINNYKTTTTGTTAYNKLNYCPSCNCPDPTPYVIPKTGDE